MDRSRFLVGSYLITGAKDSRKRERAVPAWFTLIFGERPQTR
jgi:hypothetical protein